MKALHNMKALQYTIGTVLFLTGARFGRDWRVNNTLLYRLINTTMCNHAADVIEERFK